MPAQQIIDWPTRIVTEQLVEMLSGYTIFIREETNDFVVILMQHELATCGSSKQKKESIHPD